MKNFPISRIISVLTVLFFAGFTPGSNQDPESNLIRNITEKLESYTQKYPQQKLYLHIDKSHYTTSDRLWFKAYLVDASSNKPDKRSNNLFVELINPEGYQVQAKRIKMTDGFGNGDFSFTDTVPEGRYQIRAYTNWMRNAGEEFYFKRNVYVENPEFAFYATRDQVKSVKKALRKIDRKKSDFAISFHPEGGTLLAGIENKVAFKAINQLGQSIEVKGKLLDSKGNLILETSSLHAGMGSFSFQPELKKKYVFEAASPGMKTKKFKLPESREVGINLSVKNINQNQLEIEVLTNLREGNYPPNTDYALIVHSGGILCFSTEIDLKAPERKLILDKEILPPGIAHITLFNYRASPVSERLVFIREKNKLNLNISTNKYSSGPREKIKSEISILDSNGKPVSGSFSLAIVKDDHQLSGESIYSNLLLSSDLKGFIENPDYYFRNEKKNTDSHLDLLMLTQGWRRFDWPVVMLGQDIKPEFKFMKGIEIDGKITRELFAIPLRDIKVSLTILNEFNDRYITRSGLDGSFLFDNLDYPDSMTVKIEAEKANGKKSLVIYLNDEITKKIRKFDYITGQYLRRPGEEGKRIMYSIEEEVEDDPFHEENTRINRIHSEPDDSNVIIVDESMQTYQNVAQILQGRVPGVIVRGNSVTIRGPSSFYASQDPLFLIDGIPTDMANAMQLSTHDIDRIEIIKGSDAAIYGSRGGNGVIAIYTKRGKFMRKGEIEFGMLGYYTPKEFYSPHYEINRDEEFEDLRTTLMWIPYLEPDDFGKTVTEFYNSDLPGEYSLILEGISNDGKIATAFKKIVMSE